MFSRPAAFREFLSRNNYIDEIYDALAEDDTSELVMTAWRILSKTNSMPLISINRKTKEESTLKRNEGNNAFRAGYYQITLALYNEALLLAPKGSREMKLAYSNRSALFHKLKAWTACYNDVNRVFAMGCPSDLEEKLTKRKEDALPHLVAEKLSKDIARRTAEDFIDPRAMRHNNQIPCASSDIKIVTSTAAPKVVATTNIKVGAVLAREQAYVSHTELHNSTFSCHFCQRKELNLIPCDGCCYALFCDEKCKNKCMKEYHEYECKIMGSIRELCRGQIPNLMVKVCLKLQKSCKTWDELIAASYNMGNSRIKSSSIQEIYDTNNKYSVLCCKDDKTFVYGVLYNACFVVAAVLHCLEDQIPSILPKDTTNKQQVLRALARIMMFLSVYLKPLFLVQGHNNIRLDQTSYGPQNFGLFPFISKLKNSCNPNSIVANNNNKLVLIALRPIKRGEELSVPFIWHKHDEILMDTQLKNIRTFLFYGTVCGCHQCINNDSSHVKNNGEQLSKYQKKYFSQLNLNAIQSRLNNLNSINSIYQTLLKALTVLNDVPNSKEYIAVYQLWRQCVTFCEIVSSDNIILDNIL